MRQESGPLVFLGAIVWAGGTVLAGFMGLCTLGIIIVGLPAILQGSAVLDNLAKGVAVVVVTGILPIAVGTALIVAGRVMMRAGRGEP